MKRLLVGISVVLFLGLTGCASTQLMRCAEKAVDPELYTCPEDVQGIYKQCKKPELLFRCTKPE